MWACVGVLSTGYVVFCSWRILLFELDFVKILVKVTEALLTHSPTMKLSVISAIILIGKQVMVTLKHRVEWQLELVALCFKVSCCWTLQIAVKSKSVSEMSAAIWSSYRNWCFIFSSNKQCSVWVSSSNQWKALKFVQSSGLQIPVGSMEAGCRRLNVGKLWTRL
jgi:hypothetical protein